MGLNTNRGSVNSYNARRVLVDSNTALSANEDFDSGWINSEEFSEISGTVFADGGSGDLYVYEGYSESGPERVTNGPTSVTSGSAEKISQQVDNRYVRVVYENGGSDLTTFEIYLQLR
jgi:hypothetical protein